MTMDSLPPVNQLRAFEAAVRSRSITGAAKKLNLSQAAVSRQILQLEERCGHSLFVRKTDGLELTDAGSQYFEQIAQALELLRNAGQSLRPPGDTPRRRLLLAVDGALNASWLASRLGRLLAKHPDIDLEVLVGKPLEDLSGKTPLGTNLQIVYGQPPWSRYQADKLLDFEEFPVCSPALKSRLTTLADLNTTTLIHETDHSAWRRWLEGTGQDSELVELRRGPIVHDSVSCLSMAAAGIGVAIGDNATCADWLREGRLVKPFTPVLSLQESFYLLTPETSAELPLFREFRRWLLDEMASCQAGQ